MANKQIQNGKEGYQIDEIKYAKGGGTLNVYLCTQRGMWEGSKNWS